MLAAVAAVFGALAGLGWGVPALSAATLGLAAPRRHRPLAIAVLAAGALAGVAAAARVEATVVAELPAGRVEIGGVAVGDAAAGEFGASVLVRPDRIGTGSGWARWAGPPILVRAGGGPDVTVGDLVVARGVVRRRPGRIRGVVYAGELRNAAIEVLAGSDAPHIAAGNMLRRRVQRGLGAIEAGPGVALVAGLLIGDTAGLTPAELEDLRRSGLTHYVAVSGGNVALFLAAWWLAMAPLGLGARARSVAGLLALAVFVVATRWEPSVVRAGAMAAVVLSGRILGLPVGPWGALGVAVTGLVLVSGDLAADLGFQLSVLATAGVVAGSRIFAGRRPGFAWTALGATIAAQTAVLPLLLLRIGSVPLVAPLANVVAAPLVALATATAGIGVVVGAEPLTSLGAMVAGVILRIAALGASWPQLDALGVVALALAGLAARVRSLRPVVAAVVSLAVLAALPEPVPWPGVATVSFLDVGQGDAVLLRSPDGAAALVDGGSDPDRLRRRLAARGVTRLDLVVATHGDSDHVGGLVGLVDRYDVATLWVPGHGEPGPVLEGVIRQARSTGTAVAAAPVAARTRVGGFQVTVVGPRRRYASDNDGSVVLWVEAAEQTVLLAGDVEAVAQSELPPLRPDVLLVPHHGSATSDLRWLASTAGRIVVISVGENHFGHPAPPVVETLAATGAEVRTTLEEGTIDVELGRAGARRSQGLPSLP